MISIIGPATINRASLRRLKPGVWLNDELVNSQMHLINLMYFESLKCHCFTSYFMSKLVDESKGYNFENVKRWFKDINIFNYDVVVFPITFDRCHWVSICVHFDKKMHSIL